MKEYLKKLGLGLCISYTAVAVTAAITNIIFGGETNNANQLIMFGFCVIASIVLSLYEVLDNVSPLAMIIIQYIAAVALCAVMLFIISRFEPISPRGWFEYYRSFTIPYIIFAAIYYYSVYLDTKKKNKLIQEIQNI
jgi:hypothetical protein